MQRDSVPAAAKQKICERIWKVTGELVKKTAKDNVSGRKQTRKNVLLEKTVVKEMKTQKQVRDYRKRFE